MARVSSIRGANGAHHRRTLRQWLASFAWAAAVNFSLIAGTDPPVADHPRTPIASYRTNRLIDDTWAVGEYVEGTIPRVVVYASPELAEDTLDERRAVSRISLN